MKIIVVENNYVPNMVESCQGWYLLGDSAMTNTGKPFYPPDDCGRATASLSCVIRISRLGKHIDPKFAGRYFTHCAPAVNFKFPDYERQLLSENLSPEAARSFDRALFVGEFEDISDAKPLELRKNGKRVAHFEFSDMVLPIEDIISFTSRLNTLKMGDIIVPALTDGEYISREDLMEVYCKEKRLFHIRIK